MASVSEVTLAFNEREFEIVCRALESYKRAAEEKRRSFNDTCSELQERKLQVEELLGYATRESLPTSGLRELLDHVDRQIAARRQEDEGLLGEVEEVARLVGQMQTCREGAPTATEQVTAEEAVPASFEETVGAEEGV